VRLLSDACRSFTEHCAIGIEVNRNQVEQDVANSLMLVTALSPIVGYDKSAKIAHTAHVDGSTLREAAVKLGYLTEEQFDQYVKPEQMTRPA
jgi:fumarate hydratase class II